jgi:hypothetical protein
MRPMLRSLRFRLPAIFLLGFVIAALVATAISVRFFQSYTHDRAVERLAGEGAGIVQLYTLNPSTNKKNTVPPKRLERALGGDRLFFTPVVRNFPFLDGLPEVPAGTIDMQEVNRRGKVSFDFVFHGRRYLGVARPYALGKQLFGAVVVARPTSALRSSLFNLIGQLALALAGGLLVAMLLSLYLSRRISRPLAALSRAADAVAGGRRASGGVVRGTPPPRPRRAGPGRRGDRASRGTLP